jgi:hypothetical protein
MRNVLLLAFVIVCFNLELHAQPYKTEKIAVFNFTISSADEIKMNFSKSQRDSIYNSIIAVLTSEGFQFYPVDYLKSAMHYNEFDYPQQFVSKARKSGLSKAYAKIDVDFEKGSGFSTSSSSSVAILGVGGGKEKKNTKVRCIISIKIISDKDVTLLNSKGEKESKDKISIQTDALIFGKYVIPSFDQKEDTAESLQTLLNETIYEFLKNIK